MSDIDHSTRGDKGRLRKTLPEAGLGDGPSPDSESYDIDRNNGEAAGRANLKPLSAMDASNPLLKART